MADYVVSPWVICQGDYYLGPKLKVIKAPLKNLKLLLKDSFDYLKSIDFIINCNCLLNHNVISNDIIDEDKFCNKQNCCWLWVTDNNLLNLAYDVCKSLNSRDTEFTWRVSTNKNTIIQYLQKKKSLRTVIIPFSNNEPISDKAIHEKFLGLSNVEIVWMGECLEGLHVGPIIQSLDQLNDYKKCTQEWSSAKNLFMLGFEEFWPLSLHNTLVNYKENFIQAILKITKYESYLGSCILIEKNKEVSIWTTLRDLAISETEFFKTQIWSKGLIKNLKTAPLESFDNIFIAECKSPSRGIDYLEGNSGKGLTTQSATYGAIGEAIERFSALQSNYSQAKPKGNGRWKVYSLDEFHPFGAKWEKYLAAGKPEIPLYLVKNELEENDFAYVPECLIPFPYLTSQSKHEVTTSSTSGLAVYSNYEEAVINGTLEILERNNFYPSFLNLKDGLQLDILPLLSIDHSQYSSLCQNLISLKKMSIETWFILYQDCFNLPIIHCFVFDRTNHFFSRGSGSGCTWLSAIEKSFVEALQIRQQFLTFKDKPVSAAYDNWRKEEVIEKIRSYIDGFEKVTLNLSENYTKSQLLVKIKKALRKLQKPLLVARLPKIITSWDSVRVLIPALTTHQHPSHSEGGKVLLNPAFKYGIPS